MRLTAVYATIVALILSTSAWAETKATFEDLGDNDSFHNLQTFGSAPGPDYGGPGANDGPGMTGDFLLLSDALGDQNNWVMFDNTDEGEFDAAVFSFDFIMDSTATPGQSADGFSFGFYNTDLYDFEGEIGGAVHPAEDPKAAGVLGFGFDTWNNETEEDAQGAAFGLEPDAVLTDAQRTDYQEMSVYYDGNRIARVDDTRQLTPPLDVDDGDLAAGTGIHTVTGSVDFESAKVSLQVDGNPIFADLDVAGLVPFESRVGFSARTGGEWAIQGIDNLLVEWGDASILPDPVEVGCKPVNELAGDLDGSGDVAFADFLVLSANFGTAVTTYAEGDVDCNGTVEFADFLALSANFGSTLGAEASLVPEPSAIVMILSCGLLGLVRRKRRAG